MLIFPFLGYFRTALSRTLASHPPLITMILHPTPTPHVLPDYIWKVFWQTSRKVAYCMFRVLNHGNEKQTEIF
jgi:hypothetical protein